MRRTDTTKKAVANALLIHLSIEDHPPMHLITAHLPRPGSSSDRMIETAVASGAIEDVICINDPDDAARLHRALDPLTEG